MADPDMPSPDEKLEKHRVRCREYARRRRAADPAKAAAENAEWRKNNREKVNAYKRASYAKHLETSRAQSRRRRANNLEAVRTSARERLREYYSDPENKEKRREYLRKYRADPEVKERERKKRADPAYKKRAREQKLERYHKRMLDPTYRATRLDYSRKYATDPDNKAKMQERKSKWWTNPANQTKARETRRLQENRRRARLAKVENTFTKADWQNLVARSKHCHWCKQPFTPDRPPTHDHVIPIARGGANTPANSCCAHKSCNASKGARLFNPVTGQGILL